MAVNIAKQNLKSGDEVQRTYTGRLNGQYGNLMFSKQKLLFVEEKGFLRKTYILTLEIPYNKIDDINVENRFNLAISETGGKKHIVTADIAALTIKRGVEDLIKNKKK